MAGNTQRKQEIFIVGQNEFGNQMLAQMLGQQTGRKCSSLDDVCRLPGAEGHDDRFHHGGAGNGNGNGNGNGHSKANGNGNGNGNGHGHDPFLDPAEEPRGLVLWDMMTNHMAEFWNRLEDKTDDLFKPYFVALFNAPMDESLGVRMLKCGGHGVFYQKDSPDAFVKGVQSILAGDIWVSRKTFSRFFNQARKRDFAVAPVITRREKEILDWVASGASNDKIGDVLAISPHTVRTHLSNIYTKLNLTNRFDAALWATQNL